MPFRKGIPLIIFLFFCLTAVKAQYRIDQWTADDGLPQNSVYGIVQTDDGYLWMATLDGLARFDGVRFTVFNKSNSPGIVNNRFTSLFKSADGDLWAGTEASGIVRYHNGRFTHFPVSEGVTIDSIDRDADGNPVISTSETTRIHFTGEEFAPYDPQSNSAGDSRRGQQNVRLRCKFTPDTFYGNCLANGEKLNFPLSPELNADKLRAAARDADGNFWLINDKHELIRIEKGIVLRTFNQENGLPKYPLDFITGAKISMVSWEGENSLYLTDLATMKTENFLKTPNERAESGNIYPPYKGGESVFQSAYQDDEGNLWFGTLRAGLYRARKQIITAYSTAEGLTDNNVYPLFETGDGSLLVGTTSGVFSLKNGSFAPIESPKNVVHAFGRDPSGRIVFSSFGELFVRDENRSVPVLRDKLTNGRTIHAIHTDREKAFWLGADDGLMRYQKNILTKFTTNDGLAGDDVKIIIDAKSGGIWIGTYGGLSLYKNGKFTSWTEADGLPSRTIRSLYEDEDKTLWIGTYDGGLARFKEGKFTHYNTNIGLYNDGAFQILEDDQRNFWISSNHGIYRVSRDELDDFADGKRASITSVAYGKADGMLNAEGNGGTAPAGVKTVDGRLWFPTQDGVVMIDPNEIKINQQPPPVVIETVKIDNKLTESNQTGDDSGIKIEPSQNNFEIKYTALSFINSEDLKFKYKLENLEDDWIDADTRRLAYYSHIPPGDYTFRVIAANSDGVWNETGATLKIKVLPPFYRKWWFLTLVIFTFGAALYSFFRWRINRIEKKRLAQADFSRRLINAHETERRRVAGELHDSIGQSLAMIKNSAVFGGQMIKSVDEAKEHLAEISGASAQAISEMREIAYNLRPFMLDRLGLTKSISSLLNKIADNSSFKIRSEIENIDGVFKSEAEISIFRIIQECVNNVMKHSEASEVKVKIKQNERGVLIKISDDGKGFDAKFQKGARNGFGLVGMTERVKILGGTFEANSEIGQGTTITVEIWKDK